MPLLFVALISLYPALLLVWLWLSKFETRKPSPPSAPRPVAPSVSPEHERKLLQMVCPEIRHVLEGELKAGNRIIQGGSGCDWPRPNSIIISLGFIFQSEPAPLPLPLDFQGYDPKKGEGDSINCVEHRIVVFAAMPTLGQHLSETVLVGQRRRARMN